MESKAPAVEKDYTIQWSNNIPSGVTVSASTWTLETGLTEASSSFSGTETTINVTGGEAGKTYELVNDITGSDGKPYQEVFYIECKLNIN